MRHYYAIDHPRGFANEGTITAFDTYAARAAYIHARWEHYADQDNTGARLYTHTAKEIRRLLSPTAYPDHEINSISGLNCYLGSQSEAEEQWRREDCLRDIRDLVSRDEFPAGASREPIRVY